MYGYFCKVFAAYKQATAFLYQIAGILLLLTTKIIVLVSLKSGVIKWNMVNFMSIVYQNIAFSVTVRPIEHKFI